MPIKGIPLLAYWLDLLSRAGVERILINGHHHADRVRSFLEMPRYAGRVEFVYEPELLGTAATLRQNADFFGDQHVLLAHADNLLGVALDPFVDYHLNIRPLDTALTMMTFDTSHPQSCGIVESDERGVVRQFYEKVPEPPGRRANGAVYLLSPTVTNWVSRQRKVTDFSTQVIPHYLGKIATWHNERTHRDIGTIASLISAQSGIVSRPVVPELVNWRYWPEFEQLSRAVSQIPHEAG